MNGPKTPDLNGYLAAVVVSILVMPAIYLTVLALGDGELAFLVLYPFGLVYAAIVGVPMALVGLPVVHLVARRLESQADQVVVAGVVGFALAFVLASIVDGSDSGAIFGLVTGASTMIGRASVIGLVERRHR